MNGLVRTGTLAVVAAVSVTTATAALARAVGVSFEVEGSAGEPIPISGIAFVTGVLSSVGVLLAAALGRWSGRPADRFVAVTTVLTTLSLVPPVVYSADPATAVALVVLHLLAAGLVVPLLARSLRGQPVALSDTTQVGLAQ